jgi:DNA uptake protein ComE-like DNA-binding protein
MDPEENTLPDDLDFGNSLTDDSTEDTSEVETEAESSPEPEPAPQDKEPEPEDEGEDDEGDEPSVEEDEPPKKADKSPRIPKERFDQALRKQRAAEQRALEMEQELARVQAEIAAANAPKPISAAEIQAKMAEANEALVNGDTARAAELQAEVLASLATKPQQPAQQPERDLAAEVEARLEFKSVLKDVYTRYPELDENGELFNEEIAAESVALQTSFINRGYSTAEATKKAAEAIAKLHDLEDRVTPKAPAPADKAAKLEQQAKTRSKIEKATRAAPDLRSTRESDGEPAFDINSATPEEFAALPKSVQDRLLGNVL